VKGHTRQGAYYRFPRHQPAKLRGQEALDAVDAAIARRSSANSSATCRSVHSFQEASIRRWSVPRCARFLETGMRAFTIGTAGDITDESGDAIQYARELGIEQTVKHVNPDDAVEILDDVVSACGEPFGDFSIFPTLLVSRLARQEFTVMLSGDGGDELFWGYAHRFGHLMAGVSEFRYPRSLRLIRDITRRLVGVSPTGSFRHETLGDWQRAAHSRLPEKWLARVFPGRSPWPADYRVFDYDGYHRDDAAQWLRWNEFVGHLNGVLLKVDRASMYNSLEVRVPLLDRDVIDVAAQLDWHDCFDPARRVGKIPLRRSLARHVHFQTSEKKGFAPPMSKWLRTSLRPMVEEILLTRDSLAGVIVDRNALRALYQEHLDGKADFGWGLWPLLSLALWQQRHGR
jgi:asparagine synthase (glutamine-hydrolysing)